MADIASHYDKLGYGTPEFDPDIDSLKPTLDKLGGPIPYELEHYLKNRIPTSRFDTGLIAFHSVSELSDEHLDYIPASAVLKFGFFCFAQEGDGTAFAYCIHDRKIYHLGFVNDGDYVEPDVVLNIQKDAWESWPSLKSFLLYAESELHKNLKGK